MTTLQTPLTIAAAVTASATLTPGKHVPVDATAGAVTMTLPTPATIGARLRVEKIDTSANAVTVTGQIRGVTSSIPMTSQYESREFFAETLTSWRPSADHRTTASQDARYDAAGAATTAQAAAATDATTKANSAQAFAVQRANHTGTQAASTITGLDAAVAGAVTPGGSATAAAIAADPAMRAALDARLTVATAVTANTTATADTYLPVNATSGAITVTLPTGQSKGATIVVEKEDASTNAVTMSGSLRGSAGTIALVWQYESITLVADTSGSWWPRAGHKTKASLDVAYAPLVTGRVPVANLPVASLRTQYVATSGNDANDGLSRLTPKRTIGAALATFTSDGGEVVVEGGDYVETVTISKGYTRLTGHANSRAGGVGVRIKPPTATASGLVVSAGGGGSVISGITVMSTGMTTTYTGTLVDHQAAGCHYLDVRIDNDDTTGTATTGGTGLRIENSEGNLFERVSISECNIAVNLVNEASVNTFISFTLSSNWVDLVIAGNSGGNSFLRYKGTASRNDGSTPVFAIGGGGDNVFQGLDMDEAPGRANTATITSGRNTFIGCVTAPQTSITASGGNNVFTNQKVLKAFILSGSNNKIDGIYLPAGASLTDSGTANVIQGVNNAGGSYTMSSGTRSAVLTTQAWSRPRATGRWYGNSFGSFVGNTSIGTSSAAATLIYAGGRAVWDQIGLEVTTADVSAVVRLSIYDVDPDSLLPTNLLVDAGTLTGDTTGQKTITLASPLASQGLWVAAVATVTAQGTGFQVRGIFPQNGEMAPFGLANPTLNARAGIAPNMGTMGTGAAKATWTNSGYGGNDYGVMLRRSA